MSPEALSNKTASLSNKTGGARMLKTWILVVYLAGSPTSAYTIPGFVWDRDCMKAGADLQAHAKANKLPELKFVCVEQPMTR
jgi:hypothetical protein